MSAITARGSALASGILSTLALLALALRPLLRPRQKNILVLRASRRL